MKKPEVNFKPSSSIKSILNYNEQLLFSLTLAECSKQMFGLGYQQDFVSFDGHITNERFLLQPRKFPKWIKYALKAATLIVDIPIAAEVQAEHNLKMDEKECEELNGKIIAFSKNYIAVFEVVKFYSMFTRIKFSDEGKKIVGMDEFVFCPTPSKEAYLSVEFKGLDFSNGFLGKQFAEIGNSWLANH